jgi:hypothetical protein
MHRWPVPQVTAAQGSGGGTSGGRVSTGRAVSGAGRESTALEA